MTAASASPSLSKSSTGITTQRRQPGAMQQRKSVSPTDTTLPLTLALGTSTSTLRDKLEHYIAEFREATPLARIEAERAGLSGGLVKEMAKAMGMSNLRMFEVIGVPKATAEKRAANNTAVNGTPGQAALGMVRLLGIAKAMAENSDAVQARGFNTARWLGEWIERPQPALGGRKPADMLDTPTGVQTVCKLLGAIESGAYL